MPGKNSEESATGTVTGTATESLEQATDPAGLPASYPVTGVQVAYYHTCHTKLWLFSRHIRMEWESDDVAIGKQLDRQRYSRRRKPPMAIDETIRLDYIQRGDDGMLEVHDIKKSKAMSESHRWQLRYYLWYLRQRGVEAVGVLNYPLLSRTERIELTEEDAIVMVEQLEAIRALVAGEMVPARRTGLCRRCAYNEFCWGDVPDEECKKEKGP